MKTTNYEISKKLEEAGFETYTEFYYVADAKCISQGNDAEDYELVHMDCGYMQKLKYCFNYPAYDLETILEALPENIAYKDFRLWLLMDKRSIYYCFYDQRFEGLYAKIEENESLADTAARLLLLLAEKNIINFKS